MASIDADRWSAIHKTLVESLTTTVLIIIIVIVMHYCMACNLSGKQLFNACQTDKLLDSGFWITGERRDCINSDSMICEVVLIKL
jgi:hypothetical protein